LFLSEPQDYRHSGYKTITDLLHEYVGAKEPLLKLLQDHWGRIREAAGSSHNHQAWKGGYLDHIAEVMNIAELLYYTMDHLRLLPFSLSDALVVLFLHDLEKPWKYVPSDIVLKTKEDRKRFRDELIAQYGIELNDMQKNALRYVEGVPDSEYTPGERTMGELAAFCHMCDIASARLWHDRGRESQW
jgi:hypothetical protein